MRAAIITEPGQPLELREVPVPVPAPDQVLVRVRATAVNRADLLQVAGRYPAPPGVPANIPGLEFAGEVAQIGSGVRGWSEGDRVFGIVGGASYAEYVVVHAGALAAIPPSLDFETAAAIPEAFITAHDALITQALLQPGESVLVHAVGSGVGLAAVQVTAWRRAKAFGTTRTPGKLAAARRVGMTDGIAVGDDLTVIPAAVQRWCGEPGVAVVLDLVGGAYVAQGIEALATHGRLILVGTIAGNRADLRLDRILRKRLTIRGTVLRARTDDEKAAATAAFVRDIVPALATGAIAAEVHTVFPLTDVNDAHRLVATDGNTGKVVLAID